MIGVSRLMTSYLKCRFTCNRHLIPHSKMTYVWEQYLFHYISDGGFTYLVMADDSAERFVALSNPHEPSNLIVSGLGGCHLHF